MTGKKRTAACPQCNRSMAHGTLHICPEDAATVAWLAQHLPDPDNPAYIVTQAEFDAMEDSPVSSRLLKKTYGSWRGAAHRYGLQCRDGSKGAPVGVVFAIAEKSEPTQVARINCPYCDIITTNSHPPRCPDNPAVHARIAAMLADPKKPGRAISSTRYGLAAKGAKLPAELTLKKHYGSWLEVVTAFGLTIATTGRATGRKPRQSRAQSERRQMTATCPHCGKGYAELFLAKHSRHCIQRPGMREQIRVLVEDAPGCGYGVDASEYRRRLDEWRETKPEGAPSLPAQSTIKQHFGAWGDFLHWLGLLLEDEAVDSKTAADNARYRAAWQEQYARELDPRGLFVGDDDPSKPNYKRPLVYTDRVPAGYVRTVLR